MAKIDLWMEGYRATGDESKATFLGSYQAKSFDDACDMYAKEKGIELDTYAGRISNWGRRIFDNEADARKSFG